MKNNLILSSFLNIITNIVNLIISFLISIIIYRIFTPLSIGELGLFNTLNTFFLFLAPLGVNIIGSKLIAKCETKQDLNQVFTKLITINFISTSFFSVIYFCVIIYLLPIENNYFYFIGLIPLFSNFMNVDWAIKGLLKFFGFNLRIILMKILFFIFLILLIRTENDFVTYLLLLSFLALINNLISFFHVLRYLSFDFNNFFVNFHEIFRPLAIIFITNLLSDLYLRLDIFSIQIFLSTYYLAIYYTSHRLITMIMAVLLSLTSVLLPFLSKIYSTKKLEINFLMTKITNLLLILIIPAFFGLIVISKDLIIFVFGENYIESINVFRVHAFLLFFKTFGDLFSFQLVISLDLEKILLKGRIFTLIISFLFYPIFTIFYGINGTAIVSVLIEFFIFYFIFKQIPIGIKPHIIKSTIKNIIGSVIIMVFVLLLIQLVQVNTYIRLILSLCAGSLIYFFSLLLTREKELIEFKNNIYHLLKGSKS